ARTSAATRDLDALVHDHTIGSIQSISTFLPPPEQQAQVIAEIRRGAGDRFNAARIAKTFKEALAENGFRAEAYDNYLEMFEQSLQPTEPVTLANLGNGDLTKLTTRFVKQVGGRWMTVIYDYQSGKIWPRDVPPTLLAVTDLRSANNIHAFHVTRRTQ